MAISFVEASRCLLIGEPLAWAAFEEHMAGSLTLAKPRQRRLFAFLLAQDRAKVARGDEALFAELIAAWNQNGNDPASDRTTQNQESFKGLCCNFGGRRLVT